MRINSITGTATSPASDDYLELDGTTNGTRKITATNFKTITATGSTTGRTLEARFAEVFNVRDFGAVGNGLADDLASINAAIVAANSSGGGIVFFPAGTYRTTGTVVVGDGSELQQSTKDHKIMFVGSGIGTGPDVSNQQAGGVTRILYDGSASASSAVIEFSGPLHSIGASSIVLDGAGKAGIGLLVCHCTQSKFGHVVVLRHTAAAYKLTTRAVFPSGCAYGNADNRFDQFYSFNPANNDADGIIVTSGVLASDSLIGKPDSARNTFIGGTIFYGGNTGSTGLRISGADNNTFIQLLLYPASGNDGGGKSILFTQWTGATQFPHENCLINVTGVQPIGGTSGTGGNVIWPIPTSDGISQPVSDQYLVSMTHAGTICNAKVLFLDGSASSPSMSFSGESVSGLFRQSTNSLGVSVSSTAVVFFKPNEIRASTAINGAGFTGYASSTYIFSLTRHSSGTRISSYSGVYFEHGAGSGPGTGTTNLYITPAGKIVATLPTSTGGLTTGMLWNDSGVVKIIP